MQNIRIRTKVKIDIKMVMPFFGLLLFARPFLDRILEWTYWGQISNSLIVLIDLWIGIQIVRYPLKKNASLLIILFGAFYGWTLVPTLLYGNTAELGSAGKRLVESVSLVLLLEYMFQRYGNRRTISTLMLYFEVLHYGNLLTMLLYPNGLYHAVYYGTHEAGVRNTASFVRTANDRVQWLLGHQTQLIRYVLPALTVGLLYSYLCAAKHKLVLRTKLLFLACLLEIIIAASATNYVVVAIMFLSLLLLEAKVKIKPWHFIPAIVLIYSLLMKTGGFQMLTSLMTNLLNRDVDLATRISIWARAIAAWLKHPVIGCGYLTDGGSKIWTILGNYGNPHSTYLWILYEEGIVGIVLFAVMYVYSCRNIRKYWNQKPTNVIFAAIIAMLVSMITEDHIFRYPFMLILIVVCSHVNDLVDRGIRNGAERMV